MTATHTAELAHALRVAQAYAREARHSRYGAPHLLLGVLHNDTGLPSWLAASGVDVSYLCEWAEVRLERYPKSPAPATEPLPDDKVRAVLEVADVARLKLAEDLLSPLAVLVALCRPEVAFSRDQLKTFPVTEEQLLLIRLGESAAEGQPAAANPEALAPSAAAPSGAQPAALQKYCHDKTAQAGAGRLDPIIGRDAEVRMIIEILGRRSKPNVILTGEPGVGKTALVDGFALELAGGRVPAHLREARIWELDTGALVAGASYRGEVEDRLKNILRELREHSGTGKAILFIDEIHTLLDPQGAAAGAANYLKPALARGGLTVIGATTSAEYRKFIEREEAFQRRFERLQVEEPDENAAASMVRHLLSRYESHHGLTLDPEAVPEAVRLAKRYLQDRRLPDSALDLVDRTMAAVRMRHPEEQAENMEAPDIQPAVVEANDLAETVARKTGIPVGKIRAGEQDKLLSLEAQLNRRVIGQDHALRLVSDAVREARAGLTKPGQPIGSFFFLGSTGTGKTELAKALAGALFDDETAMIRFDMSEYMEEHAAATLVGAPPGYVGYEEGGLLVNQIRQKPFSVVLFDEIEKAHRSVFRLFLQILDEGKLHDRLGKTGDFSNALILFTSNLGAEWIAAQFEAGKMPPAGDLKTLLLQYSDKVAPEFLGRLTDLIPFAPISRAMAETILGIQLGQLREALSQQGIGLEIDPEAMKALAAEGFHPSLGARPLREVIRNRLRRPIARILIAGEILPGDTLTVSHHKSEFQLKTHKK